MQFLIDQIQHIYAVAIVLIVLTTINPVRSLKCYTCHTNDNNECQLNDCPSDQAYDRCMTVLYKNPLDGRNIRKECALAPCHLRGVGQLNFVNFRSDCESSQQQDCIYCCGEDGCNKDAAHGASVNSKLVVCLMISVCFFTMFWFQNDLS